MYKSQKDKDEAIRISKIFQAFAADNAHLEYEREGYNSGETVWQTYFPSVENIIRDLYNNINIRITPKKCVPSTSINPKDKDMEDEQQKARELAELLTAFADEKQFQIKNTLGYWQDYNGNVSIGFIDMSYGNIRIKPETKRIALTMQDLIDRELRKDTMRIKRNTIPHNNYFIDEIYSSKVKLSDGSQIDYDCLAENYTWLDGIPCSKEVECE